jgi:hypothetical protein
MIVRILGEGQRDVPDTEIPALEALDARLAAAIEAQDEESFADVLSQLLEKVRTTGSVVSADTIVPSGLTLPYAGSSLAEVRDLLASEELAGD